MDVDTNRLDLLSNKITNFSATLQEVKEFNKLLDKLFSVDGST